MYLGSLVAVRKDRVACLDWILIRLHGITSEGIWRWTGFLVTCGDGTTPVMRCVSCVYCVMNVHACA